MRKYAFRFFGVAKILVDVAHEVLCDFRNDYITHENETIKTRRDIPN